MYIKEPYKTQLVEALRSGKYEQGKGYLNKGGKFCCLGVLCDILSPEMGTWEDGLGETPKEFLNQLSLLPNPVIEKVSVIGEMLSDPRLENLGEFSRKQERLLGSKYPEYQDLGSLSALNDQGVPFTIIADIIEEFC